MAQVVAETVAAQQQKAADALIDAQTKLLSAAYDKAIAYTNLIVIAGYAAFFGLWQITRDYLPQSHALWAALLIAISAAVFVLFEVTKMYVSSRTLLALNRIITDPEIIKSPQRILEELERFNVQSRQFAVHFGYWWHFVLAVCVATGLTGIGILWWSFVARLI